jgi:hypothetical protein
MLIRVPTFGAAGEVVALFGCFSEITIASSGWIFYRIGKSTFRAVNLGYE